MTVQVVAAAKRPLILLTGVFFYKYRPGQKIPVYVLKIILFQFLESFGELNRCKFLSSSSDTVVDVDVDTALDVLYDDKIVVLIQSNSESIQGSMTARGKMALNSKFVLNT